MLCDLENPWLSETLPCLSSGECDLGVTHIPGMI